MPRTGIYGVNAKDSNVLSTLSANEKAVIPITCIQELLDISLRLEGEECITQVSRFADCSNDTVTKELAVMATLRFYSNVRYLVERIKDIIYRQNQIDNESDGRTNNR